MEAIAAYICSKSGAEAIAAAFDDAVIAGHFSSPHDALQKFFQWGALRNHVQLLQKLDKMRKSLSSPPRVAVDPAICAPLPVWKILLPDAFARRRHLCGQSFMLQDAVLECVALDEVATLHHILNFWRETFPPAPGAPFGPSIEGDLTALNAGADRGYDHLMPSDLLVRRLIRQANSFMLHRTLRVLLADDRIIGQMSPSEVQAALLQAVAHGSTQCVSVFFSLDRLKWGLPLTLTSEIAHKALCIALPCKPCSPLPAKLFPAVGTEAGAVENSRQTRFVEPLSDDNFRLRYRILTAVEVLLLPKAAGEQAGSAFRLPAGDILAPATGTSEHSSGGIYGGHDSGIGYTTGTVNNGWAFLRVLQYFMRDESTQVPLSTVCDDVEDALRVMIHTYEMTGRAVIFLYLCTVGRWGAVRLFLRTLFALTVREQQPANGNDGAKGKTGGADSRDAFARWYSASHPRIMQPGHIERDLDLAHELGVYDSLLATYGFDEPASMATPMPATQFPPFGRRKKHMPLPAAANEHFVPRGIAQKLSPGLVWALIDLEQDLCITGGLWAAVGLCVRSWGTCAPPHTNCSGPGSDLDALFAMCSEDNPGGDDVPPHARSGCGAVSALPFSRAVLLRMVLCWSLLQSNRSCFEWWLAHSPDRAVPQELLVHAIVNRTAAGNLHGQPYLVFLLEAVRQGRVHFHGDRDTLRQDAVSRLHQRQCFAAIALNEDELNAYQYESYCAEAPQEASVTDVAPRLFKLHGCVAQLVALLHSKHASQLDVIPTQEFGHLPGARVESWKHKRDARSALLMHGAGWLASSDQSRIFLRERAYDQGQGIPSALLRWLDAERARSEGLPFHASWLEMKEYAPPLLRSSSASRRLEAAAQRRGPLLFRTLRRLQRRVIEQPAARDEWPGVLSEGQLEAADKLREKTRLSIDQISSLMRCQAVCAALSAPTAAFSILILVARYLRAAERPSAEVAAQLLVHGAALGGQGPYFGPPDRALLSACYAHEGALCLLPQILQAPDSVARQWFAGHEALVAPSTALNDAIWRTAEGRWHASRMDWFSPAQLGTLLKLRAFDKVQMIVNAWRSVQRIPGEHAAEIFPSGARVDNIQSVLVGAAHVPAEGLLRGVLDIVRGPARIMFKKQAARSQYYQVETPRNSLVISVLSGAVSCACAGHLRRAELLVAWGRSVLGAFDAGASLCQDAVIQQVWDVCRRNQMKMAANAAECFLALTEAPAGGFNASFTHEMLVSRAVFRCLGLEAAFAMTLRWTRLGAPAVLKALRETLRAPWWAEAFRKLGSGGNIDFSVAPRTQLVLAWMLHSPMALLEFPAQRLNAAVRMLLPAVQRPAVEVAGWEDTQSMLLPLVVLDCAPPNKKSRWKVWVQLALMTRNAPAAIALLRAHLGAVQKATAPDPDYRPAEDSEHEHAEEGTGKVVNGVLAGSPLQVFRRRCNLRRFGAAYHARRSLLLSRACVRQRLQQGRSMTHAKKVRIETIPVP